MAEKVIRVTIGGSAHLSAAHPTTILKVPMNPTYNMYRIVVVDALNVNFAFSTPIEVYFANSFNIYLINEF